MSRNAAFFAKRRRESEQAKLASYIGQLGEERSIVTGEVIRLHEASKSDGSWVMGYLGSEDGSVEIPFTGTNLFGCDVGCTVRLTGQWVKHTEYGQQFKADGIETKLPESADAIVRYLQVNVKSCGPTRAAALVDHFGTRTLDCLAAEPSRVLEVFGGKTGDGLKDKIEEWAKIYVSDRLNQQLITECMAVKLAKHQAKAAIKLFSAGLSDILLKHPYRLVEVPGIGFKTAHAVARRMGISPRDPAGIAAGVAYSLQVRMEMGDSGALREELVKQALESLDGLGVEDIPLIDQAIDNGVAAGTYKQEGDLIFLPETVALEHFIASRVALLVKRRRPLDPLSRQRVEAIIHASGLSDDQKKAIWMAMEEGFSVLTGRPGSGKTTTTKTFIRAAEALGWSVQLAAPTGKAASRASEVTGIEAKTIHRLIGGYPPEKRAKPLNPQILILDETSMADLEVMAWLLDNIDIEQTRVLCVGDNNQLPSVGHGRVLGDLIDSGCVPVTSLTEIFRQAQNSRIIVNANRLLDHKPLLLDNPDGTDFMFAEVSDVLLGPDGFPLPEDPERSKRERVKARSRLLNAVKYLIEKGAKPLRDIQVLSPMKKGDLGVDELNVLLQEALNPHGERGPLIGSGDNRTNVRAGDRILQIKNDYTLGLFNGDQGEVISIDRSGQVISARFEDRIIELSGLQLSKIRLSWAMTVHRAQGSEFPFVILIYHTSHHLMLEQSILYTAITRARKKFICIGNQRALELTVQQSRRKRERHTGLVKRLKVFMPPRAP